MHSRAGSCALALIALLALAGCARRTREGGPVAGSDSMVVSNPTERATGQLTPQAAVPAPEAPAARRTPRKPEPAPAPAPAPAAPVAPAAPAAAATPAPGPPLQVRWGTRLWVTFAQEISSESAKRGDAWSGTLRDSVAVEGRTAFPAGSVVHGTVADATPASSGQRASLALEISSVDAYGSSWPVAAKADPLIADSPRARNIAGIAGGAAAGALIGGAIGGGKGAAIGGLVGGGAAGGAVARSKGYQAVAKAGATLRFTTTWDAVVRPPAPVP